jgi:hypothetical protein
VVDLEEVERELAFFQSDLEDRGLELGQKRLTSSGGNGQNFSASKTFA